MLAHCSVTYEMVYENVHPKPAGFKKFILTAFVKNLVVSEKPYKQNNPTAPAFLIKDEKDFQKEQERLVGYVNKTQQLGAGHFEQKESHSFGKLSSGQWNNMFYKHLDHHLTQFGV
jgi:SRSO17 transposase